MVPEHISSVEVGLLDSLHGIAASVTLLETADVQKEGLSFLWFIAGFFLSF